MNEVAEYFNVRADSWDKTYTKLSPVQGAVAAIAGVREGSRVLDLGCGTGIMEPIYLGLGVDKVIALDISSRMIEIASAKFADESTLEFRCENAYEFETDEPFDAVVIYNAYPHFLNKPALAKKVASLLKPGGRFVVAHSMGREMMNKHHSGVPANVTTTLCSAVEESADWENWFDIDSRVDSPGFYCFSGTVKALE